MVEGFWDEVFVLGLWNRREKSEWIWVFEDLYEEGKGYVGVEGVVDRFWHISEWIGTQV